MQISVIIWLRNYFLVVNVVEFHINENGNVYNNPNFHEIVLSFTHLINNMFKKDWIKVSKQLKNFLLTIHFIKTILKKFYFCHIDYLISRHKFFFNHKKLFNIVKNRSEELLSSFIVKEIRKGESYSIHKVFLIL